MLFRTKDFEVQKLLDNSEFLWFVQTFMLSKLDTIEKIAEIYLAFPLDEAIEIMTQRNDELLKEKP